MPSQIASQETRKPKLSLHLRTAYLCESYSRDLDLIFTLSSNFIAWTELGTQNAKFVNYVTLTPKRTNCYVYLTLITKLKLTLNTIVAGPTAEKAWFLKHSL
jgi:hypothetical protein